LVNQIMSERQRRLGAVPSNFDRAQIHHAMLDRGTDGGRGDLEL
jgi:hypothetical protein